jgi:tripartite-type tricarboxylate transporter receptor subunit TctC
MRSIFRLLYGFILITVLACNSFADDFPSKPIKIILPFSAGSSSDISTRKIASMVSERIGQRVVVENRPGAGGNIGTAIAAIHARRLHARLHR